MFGTEYLVVYELIEDDYRYYNDSDFYGCGIITRVENEDVFIYDAVESQDILINKRELINPEYNIGCKLKMIIENYGDIIYEHLYHYFSNQIDKSLDDKNVDKFNTYSKHLNELKMEGCVIWS